MPNIISIGSTKMNCKLLIKTSRLKNAWNCSKKQCVDVEYKVADIGRSLPIWFNSQLFLILFLKFCIGAHLLERNRNN